MSDAKTELLLVKEKIKGLKNEYCWYFEQIYGRHLRWIYSQNLGVEAMKGLNHKLKSEFERNRPREFKEEKRKNTELNKQLNTKNTN